MPQFDFSTYNPQIFWFLLCFASLYLAASFLILPRIRDIIAARKNVVDSSKENSRKLEKQIFKLRHEAEKMQQEASGNYEDKMDEISRRAMKERDQALTNLKNSLDEAAKKSRVELKSLLEKSEVKATAVIQDLVQNIKTKILS
jgi:F-type H+-transporting ATPase subunit b